MNLTSRHILFFTLLFLSFSGATMLAYLFGWDAYAYKRTQDALVVLIGVFGWMVFARHIIRNGCSHPTMLALVVLTIILTMHVLRAIHGDLLC